MDVKVVVLCFVVLCLPIVAFAQSYPQIYYLTGYRTEDSGGSNGGPDWSSTATASFISQSTDPLRMTAVNYESVVNTDNGTDYYFNSYPFNGELEMCPDYFILKSPATHHLGQIDYRISKIDYAGYYLEEVVSSSVTGSPRISCIKYYYNDSMKLIRTMQRYDYPSLSWQDHQFILDDLGRRIEEHVYSSVDSLMWRYHSILNFTYSDQQIEQDYQFEKYSAYSRLLIHQLNGFVPDYLNDDWILSSVTTRIASASGEWYEPSTDVFNFVFQGDQLVLLNDFQEAQAVWGSEGLLHSVAGLEGGGCPAIELFYGNTGELNSEEELIPSPTQVRVSPNPVRTAATLRLDKACGSATIITTYNLRGQLIKSEQVPINAHEVIWQAIDAQGCRLPNGLYFVKLESHDFHQYVRLLVMNP